MSRHRVTRLLAVVLALVLVAASCGGDDTDNTAGPDTSEQGEPTDQATGEDDPTTTEAAEGDDSAPVEGEPVPGGEATILTYTPVRSLDTANTSFNVGNDAVRMFSLYGALVYYDAEADVAVPLMAESLEASDEGITWMLTLREGLVFSDGTPFDAEAVKVNWQRLKNPDTGSPSIAAASQIAEMAVVDEITLEITLVGSNVLFDQLVTRSGLNVIASAEAILQGHDLASEPIGAGPFVLSEWIRGDRMVLEANPNWFEAPRPYLDQLTIRVLSDEEQRMNTFLTEDGHLNFTAQAETRVRGEDAGYAWFGKHIAGAPAFVFNMTAPPFDDPRVRQAFVMGVDHEALVDLSVGEAGEAATNWTLEGEPWYTPSATTPEYDPEQAQALFSEVAAETGEPVQISYGGFQTTADQVRSEFIQTSLNQFDDVEVSIDLADAPTSVGRVLAKEYQVYSWGFPYLNPDILYGNLHTGLFTNYSGYTNPEVDAAFEESRTITDPAQRIDLYKQIFDLVADDLPWWIYYHSAKGFLVSDDVHGVESFQDNNIRVDMMWRSQ